MLTCEAFIEGKTFYDLELALKEILNKLSENYYMGADSNDEGDYHFSITGEEE